MTREDLSAIALAVQHAIRGAVPPNVLASVGKATVEAATSTHSADVVLRIEVKVKPA